MLFRLPPKDQTFSWLINLCSLIYKCQVEESMDLERDRESFLLFQEHGPCGLTVERLHTMMEVVESKLMVFTLSLLFKLRKRTSGWVFSSEIQMHNHQLSQKKLMETIHLPTFQLVVKWKFTFSQKEVQKKSFEPTTAWLVNQLSHHSGQWDGKQHLTTIRTLLLIKQ